MFCMQAIYCTGFSSLKIRIWLQVGTDQQLSLNKGINVGIQKWDSRQPAKPQSELHIRNQHFYSGYDNTGMMGTCNMIWPGWFIAERQIQSWVYTGMHALWEERCQKNEKPCIWQGAWLIDHILKTASNEDPATEKQSERSRWKPRRKWEISVCQTKCQWTYNPSLKPSMRAWKRGLLWGMVWSMFPSAVT